VSLTVLPGRRGVPTLVTVRQTAIDDLRDELTALSDEGLELASLVIHLARLAQMRLARGGSPADLLDQLERVGLRHQTRMTAAKAHLHGAGDCPDGQLDAPHGKAA
jgi:hypothetical protein